MREGKRISRKPGSHCSAAAPPNTKTKSSRPRKACTRTRLPPSIGAHVAALSQRTPKPPRSSHIWCGRSVPRAGPTSHSSDRNAPWPISLAVTPAARLAYPAASRLGQSCTIPNATATTAVQAPNPAHQPSARIVRDRERGPVAPRNPPDSKAGTSVHRATNNPA